MENEKDPWIMFLKEQMKEDNYAFKCVISICVAAICTAAVGYFIFT